MKIGLNLLFVNSKLFGGSVTYVKALVENLSKIDTENEYYIFLNKDAYDMDFKQGPNFKKVLIPFKFRNVIFRYGWEQILFPFYLFKYKLDVLHSPGYIGPVYPPVKRHIASILDLNYIGHKNYMSKFRRMSLSFFIPLMARKADHIITISQFSKDDIHNHLGTNPDKITVTHLAGRPRTAVDPAAVQVVREKYNITKNYIIAFSSTQMHKNIVRLVNAFNEIKNNADVELVLVGYMPEGSPIGEAIKTNDLEGRVIVTGFVPHGDIMPLLGGAKVFVFPSLYEGFGLPLLDAQSAGIPVVSSNAGSLPEVGGPNVTYFNPHDVNDMAGKILSMLNNQNLDQIIERGYENTALFSWEKTAGDTLKVYQSV